SPRRDKVVRTEGVAPSRACAHRILAPARILFRHIRKNWSIHRDVRPAVCLTKTVRRFLRVGCKNGRSGRTRTFVARQGIAFTARCICCSATLRKKWGLERDSHPRPSPYEGAALTAAPSSQKWWDASVMLRVLPGKSRRLHC